MDIPCTANQNMEEMNGDLLADVMARLDGPALASIACTCSDLRVMARDQLLWKHLCVSSWPSFPLAEAENLLSSSVLGGFDKFYSDAYPFILNDEGMAGKDSSKLPKCSAVEDQISSAFVSLVDIYWKNKCVLSKVLDGVPEAGGVTEQKLTGCHQDERRKWFLDSPFGIEVLSDKNDAGGDDDYAEDDQGLQNVRSASDVDYNRLEDHCMELLESLRLSWIIVSRNTGKAVNLSSWKPLRLQKGWPYQGDYVMNFGCVIPVGESSLPLNTKAKCVITAKFKITTGEECLRWEEISMTIEDSSGALVNGREGLMILNRALYCPRSMNRDKVDKGYYQYEKQKRETIRNKEFKEKIADGLYILIEVLTFGLLYYALTLV